MKRITYHVAANPRCRQVSTEVTGYDMAPFGIHKNYDYMITHLPTGLGVKTNIDKLAHAVEIVNAIRDKADWQNVTAENVQEMVPVDVQQYLVYGLGDGRGGFRFNTFEQFKADNDS